MKRMSKNLSLNCVFSFGFYILRICLALKLLDITFYYISLYADILDVPITRLCVKFEKENITSLIGLLFYCIIQDFYFNKDRYIGYKKSILDLYKEIRESLILIKCGLVKSLKDFNISLSKKLHYIMQDNAKFNNVPIIVSIMSVIRLKPLLISISLYYVLVYYKINAWLSILKIMDFLVLISPWFNVIFVLFVIIVIYLWILGFINRHFIIRSLLIRLILFLSFSIFILLSESCPISSEIIEIFYLNFYTEIIGWTIFDEVHMNSSWPDPNVKTSDPKDHKVTNDNVDPHYKGRQYNYDNDRENGFRPHYRPSDDWNPLTHPRADMLYYEARRGTEYLDNEGNKKTLTTDKFFLADVFNTKGETVNELRPDSSYNDQATMNNGKNNLTGILLNIQPAANNHGLTWGSATEPQRLGVRARAGFLEYMHNNYRFTSGNEPVRHYYNIIYFNKSPHTLVPPKDPNR